MAQAAPIYEVNEEFNEMMVKIIEKYPEKFNHIDPMKICCVNITNKESKEKNNGERCWKLGAVKMPVALHCPYGWYFVLNQMDWEEKSEAHKLLLVAECLHGLPNEGEGSQGKVQSPDTKGYHSIFNTFGLDCHEDPDIPHILDKTIQWKM